MNNYNDNSDAYYDNYYKLEDPNPYNYITNYGHEASFQPSLIPSSQQVTYNNDFATTQPYAPSGGELPPEVTYPAGTMSFGNEYALVDPNEIMPLSSAISAMPRDEVPQSFSFRDMVQEPPMAAPLQYQTIAEPPLSEEEIIMASLMTTHDDTWRGLSEPFEYNTTPSGMISPAPLYGQPDEISACEGLHMYNWPPQTDPAKEKSRIEAVRAHNNRKKSKATEKNQRKQLLEMKTEIMNLTYEKSEHEAQIRHHFALLQQPPQSSVGNFIHEFSASTEHSYASFN